MILRRLHCLLHDNLSVGKRRNLREVRHAHHLVSLAQCREQTPDRDARFTSDPRVDLVEHERGRRRGEHDARRQHRTGELAARRGPRQRAGPLPRVRGQEEHHAVRTVVARLRGLDLDLHGRVGHGQFVEVLLDRPGQRRGGRDPCRGETPRGGHRDRVSLAGRRLEQGRPFLEPFEQVEASLGVAGVGHHLAQRVAVLAPELPQQVAPRAHHVETGGVVGDGVGRKSQLALDVGHFGLRGVEPGHQHGERGPPVELGLGGTDRVERRAFEGGIRLRQGVAMGSRVGEQVLFGFERRVLLGIGELGRDDLVDLEAQQVDLACSRACVTTECAQRVASRTRLTPSDAVGVERVECVGAREPVERGPLDRGIEQRLVGVLAVEVDQVDTARRQLAGGGEATVDVRTAPAVARNHPREHGLGAASIQEAAFDPRFGSAVAHECRVGTTADEQLDRLDQQRLAGAGLAGDGGQAGAEHQVEIGDDPEIDDVELHEHGGAYRSARPNLAFRIWWKSRRPKVTMRAGSGPAVHTTASPAASSPEIEPVGGERDRSSIGDHEAHRLRGVEHQRAVEQHVRRDRGEQEAPDTRRHDRSAGGERIRGGAGGRGDDHAVGGVGGEERAVDLHLETSQPPGVQLLQHRLVQREPTAGRRTIRRDVDREHHPLVDLVVAGDEPFERGVEIGRLDLGEVTQLPHVDAEHRDAGLVDEIDRAQHRAVTAEREHEVEAFGEVVGVVTEVRETARGGVGFRHPHRHLVRREPLGGVRGERGRGGPVTVRDEPDRPQRPRR